MKKIFRGSFLLFLTGMSLVVQAVPGLAPVCSETAIATYKQEIVQRERVNKVVRAAVYVCAASAVFYAGYKFFHPGQSSDVAVLGDHSARLVARLAAVEKKLGMTVAAGVEAAHAVGAEAKGSFLSRTWLKGLCVAVRDMVFQSAALAGLYKVGDMIGLYAFYDKSLHSFVVRATSLGRTADDMYGYACMLSTPGFRDVQLSQIKELLKTRCVDLCVATERTVAYMRYLGDSLDEKNSRALTLAADFLMNRTDTSLATFWSLIDGDKPAEELSSGIMLTLSLFKADFEQACTRFDNAYCAAYVAARA